MFKIKIALLDTGVNRLHSYIKDNIKKCYDVVKINNCFYIRELKIGNNDINGHGTACASVIKKECSDIEIYSFRVFDKEGFCSVEKLENVLDYIKEMDVDIINLSLSIIEKVDITVLTSIINEINKKGKILVSSLANNSYSSYPAILKGCIGVQGFILDTRDSIWFNRYKKIQCVIDNEPYLHCDLKNGYTMFGKSNSYAAARISGKLAAIMLSNGRGTNREEIDEILTPKSEKKYWIKYQLKRSKRYPDINQYKYTNNKKIIRRIEKVLVNQLNLDNQILFDDKILFSNQIGLKYEHCYSLLKNLEQEFRISINNYTLASREDFFSIYHVANFISKYI